MKDYGIDKGLVQYKDDSKRNQRGWGKGFFGFRKMHRDYLGKLNVPFYDSCCPSSTATAEQPVRYNSDTDRIERFNTETGSWANAQITVGSEGISSGSQLAGFFPTAAAQDIAAGTGGAINVTSYYTSINTDAGGDAFSLANGTVIGQRKRIRLVVDGGGDGVVTPANLAAATTITFNDAGDDLELIWDGTDWVVLVNIGATVA